MNRVAIFMSAVIFQLFMITACSDNDLEDIYGENSKDVPTAILENFLMKYPHAKNIKWEVDQFFATAEFYTKEMTGMANDDHNATAWFKLENHLWKMTEFEMQYSSLPSVISEAFEQTEFAKVPWRTDNEIEKIIRADAATLYIINVEKDENDKELEIDLIYTEDGILIGKEIDQDDNDHSDYIPETITEAVVKWLEINYPNAQIVDIDIESDHIEMEILDGQIKREVYFDSDSNWIYTETEIRYFLLPDIVQQAFKASTYAQYEVDEVKEYKTKKNDMYYGLELEYENDRDLEIFISADGKTITQEVPW